MGNQGPPRGEGWGTTKVEPCLGPVFLICKHLPGHFEEQSALAEETVTFSSLDLEGPSLATVPRARLSGLIHSMKAVDLGQLQIFGAVPPHLPVCLSILLSSWWVK